MFKVKIILFLLFLSLSFSLSYGQSNSDTAHNRAYNERLAYLVKQGNHLLNNSDSLLYVIDGFRQLKNKYHDSTSQVYIDYYTGERSFLASQYYEAMKYLVLSLNEAHKAKVTEPIPYIYGIIGETHKENANYPMAFAAAQNGINAAIANRDTPKLIELLGDKAMFIRGYSMHFNKPIDKDSSLAIRMAALKLAESNPKFERNRMPFYDNIGQHYFLLKNYAKSMYFLKKAIPIGLKYNMQRSLTYNYDWLAEDYYMTGHKKLAGYYFNTVLDIENKIKQPHRTMETYQDMSNCYYASGDYKNSIIYLHKYIWLLDSLQVRKNEQQIGELQIKYESVKKDRDLALLNLTNKQQTKQLTWLACGALLFLLFIVILIYTYNIVRNKNKRLKASNAQINEQSDKLQTLMQELHHRVKNNLQVVSSLLMLQSNRMDNNEEARNALDVSRQRIEAMSIIHNSLYQHGSDNRVHLKEFLPILLNNLLESFGRNRADMNIGLDITVDDIDVDIAMPLGLIINEWVTNVFKHAYKNKKEKADLDISVFNDGGRLKLKIKDNGVGMPMALWENPKGSFGVKLIKILIKQIGGKASVLNALGTTFELDIPYLKII